MGRWSQARRRGGFSGSVQGAPVIPPASPPAAPSIEKIDETEAWVTAPGLPANATNLSQFQKKVDSGDWYDASSEWLEQFQEILPGQVFVQESSASHHFYYRFTAYGPGGASGPGGEADVELFGA